MGKPQEKEQVALMRILGTDIRAENTIMYGLANIKGINIMFSNAVCHALKLDKNAKMSSLSEKDVEKIEQFLTSKDKKGIPSLMKKYFPDYMIGSKSHLTRILDRVSFKNTE